jgi:hypothetical protein
MGASKEVWMSMMVPFYRGGVHTGYIRHDGTVIEPEKEEEVKPFSNGTVY